MKPLKCWNKKKVYITRFNLELTEEFEVKKNFPNPADQQGKANLQNQVIVLCIIQLYQTLCFDQDKIE